MQISRANDQAIVISGLDSFFLELLQQVPTSAEPQDNEDVEKRLFSNPTDPDTDPRLCADWQEYVEPELRHLFQSANNTVRDDLEGVKTTKASDDTLIHTLCIPIDHFDAWLNSLNQARLALTARHGFTEIDMEARTPKNLSSNRALSLLQVHFYGYLQEIILGDA